jgi:extradiol dioxygenase family protein
MKPLATASAGHARLSRDLACRQEGLTTCARLFGSVPPPVTARSELPRRARLVGINHVALEVDDLDEALSFYGGVFVLGAVEREDDMAFIDLGDQFLALVAARRDAPDAKRHFGLVVADREVARSALVAAGVELLPGPRMDFRDPFGNRVQVVDYRDIQFTKTPSVLGAMGLPSLHKRPDALRELRAKGLIESTSRSVPSRKADPA